MRKRTLSKIALAMAGLLVISADSKAQLSQNPDKFLGNITTWGQVNYGGTQFNSLWNQITCENETKWQSVQGNSRTSWNWNDAAYNYAKDKKIPFKFHTLIWGSQYPSWMNNLSPEEQYKAIEAWFDAAKKRYPDLEMIDVVNEAIAGHAPAPFKEALGGDGKTGYDWIIKSFEMAYERWPDAILIYNDYNTFQWQKSQFIDLVRTLRDAGAPIDAYGCQSHDLTDMSFSDFKSAMTEIQNALKMPMYSTEYDIGTTDDDKQEQQYKDQIKYMWESDYCAGITLWGYIYGATWVNITDNEGNVVERGISGIIKDGEDRPAMTWLRDYMASNEAKTAKSPFPGMKKQISLYIKPTPIKPTRGDTLSINVRAEMVDKSIAIDSVKLYVKNVLDTIMTEAPYIAKYVPSTNGKYALKAIVYTNDGKTYQREGSFTAYNPRKVFRNDTITLPGTLQVENFDEGADGVSYHDSDSNAEGDGKSYRSDNTGVDIVTGNGGYAIGYTSNGEWLEYTVNVEEAGVYTYTAYVSSGTTGSSFSLSLNDNGTLTGLSGTISVPQTGSNDWSSYTTITGRLKKELEEGKNIIHLDITGSSCNIDKIVFRHIDYNEDIKLSVSSGQVFANQSTKIKVAINDDEVPIDNVKIYQGTTLLKTITEPPYEVDFKPTKRGEYSFQAVATDTEGGESDIVTYKLKVSEPFSGKAITIPGIIQIEDFDKGGEGFAFHDSDSDDEGDANYRSDNGGVDLKARNGGIVIGNTADGEWLEYTVDVQTAGDYLYSVTASSGVTNSGFQIGIVTNGVQNICKVNIPQTADNSWSIYTAVNGKLGHLDAGIHILRVTIDGGYCNIDKIELKLDPSSVKYVLPDDRYANGNRYNLGGIRVNGYQKGITIIDGKKVYIME